MSKINVLSPVIFNRIAAGEVVEKPCSAVKELVENSIDAGAQNINICIENGGLKLIEVADDGCGIEFDDLKKALLPHATSKINKIDDLEGITTLGFRGEALASISSVSDVEIISKTKSSEFGGKLCSHGGDVNDPVQIGCADGTRIRIQNLFYNVPARLKFMRKAKTEENDITNYIARLILANPTISFTYIADNKTIYKHRGSDLKTAILDVYGPEYNDLLISVDQNKGNMKLSGFIGKPEIAKSNRTYQTLIINGRYVVNYMISSSIANVYDDFLMKGKFPFYVLNLTIPFEEVDVNVHPNKLEVKFENPNAVFSLFNSACFYALNTTDFTRSVVDDNIKKQSNIETNITPSIKLDINKDEGVSYNPQQTPNINLDTIELANKTSLLSEIILTKNEEPISEQIVKQDRLFNVEQPNKHLCTLFDTYILIQKGDDLYMVDQHAAHERLNYDKLQKSLKNKEINSQKLLFPIAIEVNAQEENFLVENLDILTSIGFNISEFGDRYYRVDSIPFVLSGLDIKEYFNDIFKDLNSYVNKPLNFIKDSLCQKACKSSVKGGNKLSEDEIQILIDTLKEQNSTLLCPHGRPIIVKLTKTDIEKWFKRIV